MSFIWLLIPAIFFALLSVCISCQSGWSYYQSNDSCYKFFPGPETWGGAQAKCRGEAGDLAIVDNAAENLFVQSIAMQGCDRGWGNFPWIAGRSDTPGNDATKYQWKWDTGRFFRYTNWCPQLPNYRWDKEERCVQLVSDNCPSCGDHFRLGCWNNMFCEERLPFVCKKKEDHNSNNNNNNMIHPPGPPSFTTDSNSDDNIPMPPTRGGESNDEARSGGKTVGWKSVRGRGRGGGGWAGGPWGP
ncbi:hypothetical protein L596_021209 [Steinernema carpocapsae]|uniref:C-type lectin domain-containing protein n=1 Tax=Steinernema carpocapsae TaxID=34508 RepID=A0A4U5MW44_STECR|nr:hypothetical protein L596_021209 [Steinernema carpocapsae]